jgi:hypothetical protein
MKYAVKMGSGAMIYMLSFMKFRSGIQKLIERRHTQTQRQHADSLSLPLFFQNKLSKLKICLLLCQYNKIKF